MLLPILVRCNVVKIDTSSGIYSPRVFQNNKTTLEAAEDSQEGCDEVINTTNVRSSACDTGACIVSCQCTFGYFLFVLPTAVCSGCRWGEQFLFLFLYEPVHTGDGRWCMEGAELALNHVPREYAAPYAC
jgi:hypothetical protein